MALVGSCKLAGFLLTSLFLLPVLFQPVHEAYGLTSVEAISRRSSGPDTNLQGDNYKLHSSPPVSLESSKRTVKKGSDPIHNRT